MCRGPTESVSSSSSYSSMSVLMLSSRDSLSSSSQPTKNVGAPRRLSPGLLGSDITVPRGRPQGPAAASDAKTRRRRRGGEGGEGSEGRGRQKETEAGPGAGLEPPRSRERWRRWRVPCDDAVVLYSGIHLSGGRSSIG
ncbi:hypothetical protein EYF80_040333 [Liparis tanakae]|uniref:Uncharacterized protein n=1 Tax=Liparis tanakae TaxID=230148 RepID=A0A4Z2GAA9_9TELE|nr:hypothetical protein EYF80_040333 [Liparis tanakae]